MSVNISPHTKQTSPFEHDIVYICLHKLRSAMFRQSFWACADRLLPLLAGKGEGLSS